MTSTLTPADIALVTYSELPELAADEQMLARILSTPGVTVRSVAWDDPAVDWSGFGVCVIRSTWDYHHRLDDFLAWAARISSLTHLWNPVEAVRWNSRKTYLRDLAERGIAIVPTAWLKRGSHADLAAILSAEGWHMGVVKPVVSASAYATIVVTPESIGAAQAHLDNHLAERDMMVQPFLASVQTSGERSLMFIDGHYSHAVRRTFPLGQSNDKQEKSRLVEASQAEITFATNVLQAADYPTLYARVDIVRDESDVLRLMELELIEPSLFLQEAPKAAERLAAAIARRLP